MNVIGIVAEYNPFHRGHAWHIARSRELLGEDAAVVCVLSGDFVQRGEPAIFDKFTRAEAACRGGVDLVVELPLPWCLSSAEGFARGAVSLLDALGCTHLSFGCEAGELAPLEALAEALLDPALHDGVKRRMDEQPSQSYAAARQCVVEQRLGDMAKLLETPNNILAVEYLKALRLLKSDMKALAVPRFGSAHDGEGGALPSGAELRRRLLAGEAVSDGVPPEAAAVFRTAVSPNPGLWETAVLSRLRALDGAQFDRLPDASDGLGRRLARAAAEEPSLDAIQNAIKSKRYAMSRVRRLLCCAALCVEAGMADGAPPYARVLAANARGCELLRERRGGALPILTKPAAVRDRSGRAEELFSLGAAAHDLYALCDPRPDARRGGEDWRRGPAIL